jgi:hypothetical protein
MIDRIHEEIQNIEEIKELLYFCYLSITMIIKSRIHLNPKIRLLDYIKDNLGQKVKPIANRNVDLS